MPGGDTHHWAEGPGPGGGWPPANTHELKSAHLEGAVSRLGQTR